MAYTFKLGVEAGRLAYLIHKYISKTKKEVNEDKLKEFIEEYLD